MTSPDKWTKKLLLFIPREVNNMRTTLIEILTKVGKKAAEATAGTNCLWIHYQPEEPNKLKKMRSNKEKREGRSN